MKDEEILRKIAEKDPYAFRQFFEQYQELVFHVCLGILNNRQQAEDATQDVFFQIYRSAKSFRSESKVSTWLYRISVNRSLNILRRNRRQRWFRRLDELLEHGPDQIASSQKTPDQELEEKEQHQRLRQTIDSLPPNQKTVFVLHKYEGLSYKRISEILNISLSSVESRMFRAKKYLQKNFLSLKK